ncbi:MAG: glycosyltransferase family 2 protein [Eggerthella lenta]
MEDICIFTPTYNRAHTLSLLFESLVGQNSQRFYWLVVDDGSTDETEALIKRFSLASPFRVVYVKQENGGKQRVQHGSNTVKASCSFAWIPMTCWFRARSKRF